MRVFGIDPGSHRTGFGCVETDGRRHRLVACGAVSMLASTPFPDRLARIYRELTTLLTTHQPDCVAIENLFHAVNVRSALKLGHARGVAMLAAIESGCEVVEYTPAEIKRAVVGYGRADKRQVQQMIKLLLGLAAPPSPHDAADALAVAVCHVHNMGPVSARSGGRHTNAGTRPTSSPAVRRTGSAESRSIEADPSPSVERATLTDVGRVPLSLDPSKRTRRTVTSWRSYRPPS